MSKPDQIRPLLTLSETAAFLNVSETTVRRIAADLNAYKVKGQLRFSMTEIEKYLASRSLAGRGKVRRPK